MTNCIIYVVQQFTTLRIYFRQLDHNSLNAWIIHVAQPMIKFCKPAESYEISTPLPASLKYEQGKKINLNNN